jgi:uncharacterized protein (TIGR02270 family)
LHNNPVLEQHAEEAGFLWLIRDKSVSEPHYTLADLTHLDCRLLAHTDGLHIAGEAGWEVCKRALLADETGEVFTTAVLAIESGRDSHIQMVFDANRTSLESSRGLISALGWLPCTQSEKYIITLISASSPVLRRVGIAANAIHRKDPGHALEDVVSDGDFVLRARALRAVGELGRMDLLAAVHRNLASEDDKCRFCAAWSAAILGDMDAVDVLKAIAGQNLPEREEAAAAAFRRMDISAARKWQTELTQNNDSVRLAIIGAGAIGDPTSIPWLIDQMQTPTLARVAGESFTMVAGVDIAYEDLEEERPEGFESGPTEDPEDENVEMDPDENLPWPNPEMIQKWWSNHRSNFQNGTRYLIGKPISEEWLQQVLRIGRQRQRAAAALELVLKRPGQPLFEVRAPGFRQQQMLGLKQTK